MLPQQYLRPYTSTLSMLRKIDLLRLCVELKLPNDGTVLNLRDRLRVYLNAHSDTLYRNPRYRPLYPQHRRLTRSTAPREQIDNEPANRSPSPTTSDSSDSSNVSYESWNGIEGPPLNHIPDVQPPFYPAIPPPPVAHDAPEYYPPPPPPPSPSIPGSEPGHFPFSDHDGGSRKFIFFFFPLFSSRPHSCGSLIFHVPFPSS